MNREEALTGITLRDITGYTGQKEAGIIPAGATVTVRELRNGKYRLMWRSIRSYGMTADRLFAAVEPA
jgi:hypothetical protein